MSAIATGLCSSATLPLRSIRSESHRRHTRRVHHAPHTLLPRRFEQRARALDIRAIHLLRIAHPQPVIGRHVKHNLAAGKRLLNRSRVAQIAGNPIGLQILNIPQIAGRPHQQPQLRSLFRQNASYMTAQESRSAGDKSFQTQFSVLSSQFSVNTQSTRHDTPGY